MKQTKKHKILVILGPTASGKSDLAVELARKFEGEIISADSRQVYKGLDIGTGKITKKEMRRIKHYMLDVVSPKTIFNVIKFKKKTDRIISDIIKRNKLPILCGGTGFYIQAIVDNISIPEVVPDKALRARLAEKSTDELFKILEKLDKRRAVGIDKNNPHRLIRAIEIATHLGSVPKLETRFPTKYEVLQIGIKTEDDVLKERIHKRLLSRIKVGMVTEVRKLHEKGMSWKRMESLGLEYKYLAKYLKKELTKNELLEQLYGEICRYAKRQKTWFKRDKKIKWFNLKEKKKIESEIKNFLKK
jgi:tRNA dimethylallyltransferase